MYCRPLAEQIVLRPRLPGKIICTLIGRHNEFSQARSASWFGTVGACQRMTDFGWKSSLSRPKNPLDKKPVGKERYTLPYPQVLYEAGRIDEIEWAVYTSHESKSSET